MRISAMIRLDLNVVDINSKKRIEFDWLDWSYGYCATIAFS